MGEGLKQIKKKIEKDHRLDINNRTTGHWMATGKAWGLASSLWEALLAWGAGGGPVEATATY